VAARRTHHAKRSVARRQRKTQSKGRFIEEWGWLLLLVVLTAALVGLVTLTDVTLPHSPLLPRR
jgi:hypothetical protein